MSPTVSFLFKSVSRTSWQYGRLSHYPACTLLSLQVAFIVLFYFMLSFKGLSACPGKNQYPTQDFNGKENCHHKYIFKQVKINDRKERRFGDIVTPFSSSNAME